MALALLFSLANSSLNLWSIYPNKFDLVVNTLSTLNKIVNWIYLYYSNPTNVSPQSTNNVIEGVPQAPRAPPAPPRTNNIPPAAPPLPAPSRQAPPGPLADFSDLAMSQSNKAKPAKSFRQDVPNVRLFNPKDLKLTLKRLKRPEEIIKQGNNYGFVYIIGY